MMVVGVVVVAAAAGLARDVTAPAGDVRNMACAWHGPYLVATGIVVNHTMSAHDFVVAPTFALGRSRPFRPGTLAVPVRLGRAGTWRWVDGFVPDRSGTAITTCTATVRLPSPDD
jgi:hypothetical protein